MNGYKYLSKYISIYNFLCTFVEEFRNQRRCIACMKYIISQTKVYNMRSRKLGNPCKIHFCFDFLELEILI